MLSELAASALNLIYENRCGVCHSSLVSNKSICDNCDPNQKLLLHSKLTEGPYCVRCGDSLFYETDIPCSNCISYPLPLRYIRSLWAYADSAERVICSYKYGNNRSLSGFLRNSIIKAINQGSFPPEARYGWDLIVPLPSTEDSLRERTFSPVGEIAKQVGRHFQLPVSQTALRTYGKHPPQASLSSVDRLKKIRRKFKARKLEVINKRILILEDVITSGASILGSCLALKDAGASEVDCLSLSRSDLFSQLRSELFCRI